MSKFDEILNSSDASDALLGEQIDRIADGFDTIGKTYMFRKISKTKMDIQLYDNVSYLLTVQSGTDGDLYMIYTSTGAAPRICKVATGGSAAVGTVSATADLVLSVVPSGWICCTLVAISTSGIK